MNRKSIIRRMRKNVMRNAIIVREEILNRDDDGKLYPKKEWGYCVEVIANGWLITAPDDNRYESYKGVTEAIEWALEQQPGSWIMENGKPKRLE